MMKTDYPSLYQTYDIKSIETRQKKGKSNPEKKRKSDSIKKRTTKAKNHRLTHTKNNAILVVYAFGRQQNMCVKALLDSLDIRNGVHKYRCLTLEKNWI